MIAVGFATVGLAFEIATTAFPSSFVVLAGLGNFSKALGKGLSSPSFRIIQTHFAKASNVGEVSAKEEVCGIYLCCLAMSLPRDFLVQITATMTPSKKLAKTHMPSGRMRMLNS